MRFEPSPFLVMACILATLFTAYNCYRAWFELEKMHRYLQENIDRMPAQSPLRGFFQRRISYPGWRFENRAVATINFVLMLLVTIFVMVAYFG